MWEILIAFLLGFGVNLLFEELRRPWLRFAFDNGEIASRDGVTYRFVSISVSNEKRLVLSALHRPASNARCWVIFTDPLTKTELLRMDGRWASGPEPYDYVAEKVDLAAVLIPQRETVPVGESGFAINVAIKFEGDEHFYAFTNESYAPADDGGPWRHSKFRLDQDHACVSALVLAEGREFRSPEFVLRNPDHAVRDFCLA